MDISKLVATGLTTPQAEAYALLLQHGSLTPPQTATKLRLSRTNAYKLLDKLVDIGLAKKDETSKKATYLPDNPMALSNLVIDQRSKAAKQEEAVRQIMSDLLATYHTHTEQPSVELVSGRDNVVNAYRKQIALLQPIYFVRSSADIAGLGYETMHEIRITPGRHGVKRYAIAPDVDRPGGTKPGDTRSNLDRTWMRKEDYTGAVEWSISGSTLLIVIFGSEPHAITIDSPLVTEAFLQLWKLLDSCLKAMPYYKTLPRG